tara:strand:- start:369 stop:2384 length:2016 start_codon:yes stop_codon:yes gene_type:complete
MEDFKYKTTFEYDISANCSIRDIKDDLKVSRASLAKLKGLIPQDLDLDTNVDLLGVAFPFAVVNQFNANDDAIDTDTALAIKSSFINKPMNVEHYRWEIIGHVVSSQFSDHYTSEVLPSVAGRGDIFDMSLGAVVYKLADSRYVDIIKDIHEGRASEDALSTSWEIGFNEFKIGVGGRNLADCEIISDPEQIEAMKPLLKAFGGSGETLEGTRVRRIITGKALGLGGGFTSTPAADVKGVYIEKNDKEEDVTEEEEDVYANAKFTRQEVLDDLAEMLKSWTDEEHDYYQDLKDLIGDIMIEEEAKVEFDKKQLKKEKEELQYVIDWEEDEGAEDKNKYGGKTRSELKDSDFLDPTRRSFPVVNCQNVKDAVSTWGLYKGKMSFDTFKERLTKKAKKLGCESALPAKWKNGESKSVINTLTGDNKSSQRRIENVVDTIMDTHEVEKLIEEALAASKSKKLDGEAVAKSISQVIIDEIRKESERLAEQKENEQAEAANKAQEAQDELDNLKSSVERLTQKLGDVEAEKASIEAQATFSERMEQINEIYSLDEDESKFVAAQLTDVNGEEEAFAKFKEELAVILKHKSKEYISEQEEKFEKEVEAKVLELSQASLQEDGGETEEKKEEESAEDVAEAAIGEAKATAEEPSIPNSTQSSTFEKISQLGAESIQIV